MRSKTAASAPSGGTVGRLSWLAVLTVLAISLRGEPLARLTGEDFEGGAKDRFGTRFHGRDHVNYVYAESTGAASSMRGSFNLIDVPAEPQFLFLEARDDDAATACRIEILLNGARLLAGPSGFPDTAWQTRRFAIPDGILRRGRNELTIFNREPEGRLGLPPWFMVGSATVADGTYRPPLAELARFRLVLPATRLPLPEPLGSDHPRPGFALRGTKGWMWRAAQYLEEIPVLARYRMNFLMNCYGSMCDIEHHPWGSAECNRWWEPLPPAKRRAYEEVVRSCQRHGITFCFSMNPNLTSERFADPDRPQDVEALWQHYRWMQRLGVRWFNLSLDDITQGVDAAKQARLVNEILRRLRAFDPEAQMIFCPTFYWGDGQGSDAAPYLKRLASDLHPDIRVFWTGDAVVTPLITRRAAESYRKTVGHRLFLWDNYPVNDGNPTLNLGPVSGRDPDLCEVIDGYMANPLSPQNEINRVPLLTCADYAYNPWAYDPARSIGQAIVHLGRTPEQCLALAALVEAYPGMLFFNQATSFNPVRARFTAVAAQPDARAVQILELRGVENLYLAFRRAFPVQFRDAQRSLLADLEWMKSGLARE